MKTTGLAISLSIITVIYTSGCASPEGNAVRIRRSAAEGNTVKTLAMLKATRDKSAYIAAINGALEKSQLETAKSIVNMFPGIQYDAMDVAAVRGNADFFRFLSEKGAKPHASHLVKAIANGHGEFADAYLSLSRDNLDLGESREWVKDGSLTKNGQWYRFELSYAQVGPNPLYYAIKSGKADLVAKLLSAGCDPNRSIIEDDENVVPRLPNMMPVGFEGIPKFSFGYNGTQVEKVDENTFRINGVTVRKVDDTRYEMDRAPLIKQRITPLEYATRLGKQDVIETLKRHRATK